MIRTLEEFDLESFYDDAYEPEFPSPLEILVFCGLVILSKLARLWRWCRDNSGFVIVVLAVLGYFFGFAATFIPYFLHGGKR